MIHTLAVAKNKAVALTSITKVMGESQASSGGNVSEIYYVITYDEPWQSDRPAALADQRNSSAYQSFLQSAEWSQYFCQFIPKSAAAVGHEQLTLSRVPVLAFNGAADPIDPPPNMAGTQKFWPNSRELALPGQGHEPSTGTWAGPLIQAFIEQASVAHLDTSCHTTSPRPALQPDPPSRGGRVKLPSTQTAITAARSAPDRQPPRQPHAPHPGNG